MRWASRQWKTTKTEVTCRCSKWFGRSCDRFPTVLSYDGTCLPLDTWSWVRHGRRVGHRVLILTGVSDPDFGSWSRERFSKIVDYPCWTLIQIPSAHRGIFIDIYSSDRCFCPKLHFSFPSVSGSSHRLVCIIHVSFIHLSPQLKLKIV